VEVVDSTGTVFPRAENHIQRPSQNASQSRLQACRTSLSEEGELEVAR